MNIEDYRNYCMSKKEVTEHFPFDKDTLVFKVCNKMFALASLKKWDMTWQPCRIPNRKSTGLALRDFCVNK